MHRRIKVAAMTAVLTIGLTALAAGGYGTLDIEKAVETMELYIERNPIPEVRTVFSFFVNLISAPLTAREHPDGIYRAESVFDDYQYRHVITLDVKGGRISKVDYDEIKSDGTRKQMDSTYNAQMLAGTGTSPSAAYPVYESRLLEKQNMNSVNAVTGATYSLYRFRMTAIRALMSDPVPADTDSTSAGMGWKPPLPGGLRLSMNYPNPFNAGTRFRVSVPQDTKVVMEIVDVGGCRIRTLVDGVPFPGEREVCWDGLDDRGVPASSGVLMVRLTAGNESLTRKMVSVK